QRLGQSVLDAVIADADALSARLGGPDRARLDEHLTAVRELERRLWLPPADPGACGATPPDPGADPTAQVEAMMEVIALALACDRSRVVSHMISMGESYRALAFLGHPIAHHSASHVDPVAHEAVATWSVERFAWLVARLGRQVDPDGVSLLDRTLLMYTSDMSVGLQHDHRDLPVLLAGRGLAGVPLGEHVVLPEGTPLHDLLLAILQGYGAPVTAFGARGTTPALPLG
ncbi:MAG TPA: DUF1552 domain-containing protein, partial [Myxococcota bacterium]|nr:DUF1552 domain-containing protein [Myxococcota bacterium]